MSWGSLIGAGITAMTGRRDNKQAAKAARREQDWEEAAADNQFIRQKELQEDSQAFEASQAATAMQFSERMASTQHQREIKDLYAAGLNPILSGSGGQGAAAPVGIAGHSSAGTAAKAGAAKQTIFPQAQAIMAGAASGAQIELAMAQKDKTEAEAEEIRARTPRHQEDIELTKATVDNVLQDTQVKRELEKKSVEEQKLIKMQLNKVVEEIWETFWSAEEKRSNVPYIRSRASAMGVEARTMQSIENINLNEILKAAPALAPFSHLIKPLLMQSIKSK